LLFDRATIVSTMSPPPPPSLDALPARDPSGDRLAVIEAAQGSRHKLKYRAEWRAFVLHGVLPLGTAFPYDFGFLPSTLGDDGDPLDVLVFADEALLPGSVVPCRIVGVIEAEQRKKGAAKAERNDRLLAVAAASQRWRECRGIDDVAAHVLDEVERFFVFYNEQKAVRFRPLARRGAKAAQRLVDDGAARWAKRAAEST
jgi:inorganic pyrophosphatase